MLVLAVTLVIGVLLGAIGTTLLSPIPSSDLGRSLRAQYGTRLTTEGTSVRSHDDEIPQGLPSTQGMMFPGAAKLEPAPQVCVVAGVGPGIGEHLARRFATAGCRVALLARKSPTDIAKSIPGSLPYACDVTNATQVQEVFAAIQTDLGPVDALLYNVGGGKFLPYDKITQDILDMDYKTNALGLLLTAQQVGPGMASRGHGVIGVTGATSSWRGLSYTAGFAPGKFASRGLAQSLARDLGPKGVHVFHVVVDGGVGEPPAQAVLSESPPELLMHPEDIAETYFNLAVQPRSAWTFETSLFAWADTSWYSI